MKQHPFNIPVLNQIREIASDLKVPAYLVGGYVRDVLLGRSNKDIDIVVVGKGPEFAGTVKEALGKKATLSVFKNFGTAQIRYEDLEIEFVGARKESYQRHSRNPVIEEGTLEDDLSRRDFTINTLAVSLDKKAGDYPVIDLFDGLEDLKAGIIRTPLDPDITFSDDPLRMMRAIRFASQLSEFGFELFPDTFAAIERNKERLEIISKERITEELNKIILSPKPSVGFKLLHLSGLLQLIFPEFLKLKGVQNIENKSHKDNFYHTLQVVDNIAPYTDNLWLRWAALLHDIGKPATQRFDKEEGWTFHGHEVVGARMVPKIFKNMRLPLNEKMKYVQKLVLLHLRPIALTKEVTDSAIRRIIVDAGEDLEDLMLLCRADVTSKNPERVKRYHARFEEVRKKIGDVEERDRLRNWNPPITGEIIMETFGLKPSKPVGIIKDAVREAILNGDIPNEYEPAYRFMLKTGEDLGYKAGSA